MKKVLLSEHVAEETMWNDFGQSYQYKLGYNVYCYPEIKWQFLKTGTRTQIVSWIENKVKKM
jgi:hypothetical protein